MPRIARTIPAICSKRFDRSWPTSPVFRGLYLLRHTAGAEVEYQVLTLWDSVAAIRNFASPDLERAVVEPEARAALLRYDATVRHFEVLARPDAL